jgi:hypothetical protein
MIGQAGTRLDLNGLRAALRAHALNRISEAVSHESAAIRFPPAPFFIAHCINTIHTG